ncbi:MAG: tol-pal system protein YbgF [Candidatus Aminicenantales bacterium]
MKKHPLWGILVLLLVPVLLSGTDKSKKAYELIYKDVQILKQQVLELDKKIEKNHQEIQALMKTMEDVLTLIRNLQSQQVSLQEDQKKLPAQYQILLEKMDSITLQLSRFSEDLLEIRTASLSILEQKTQAEEEAAPPEEGKESPPEKTQEETQQEEGPEEMPKAPPPNLSPQEIYNMAYADYLKGNFQLAIDGFQIYLDNFAESPFADNALYWIGECYFSQKEYEKAIDRFNELILTYPLGDKIPAAYLKKGISLMELGRKEEALAVFKLLVSKYPLEEETKIAQEKIKELVPK